LGTEGPQVRLHSTVSHRRSRRLREPSHEIAAGSLYVGSPETVARNIAATVQALGASRLDLKYSAGTLPHEAMLRSIELYGREVIPRVRELLAQAESPAGVQGVAASGT
jgi:alkanesulfonate monooxygenase SsuD/methylene tetrahydromethanopterin reductase-like flavin-dependent oxidoreductase (luciferase family)